MDPLYRPQGVEERWQRIWEEVRLYRADPEQPGDPYVIAVPPPNVTGALHMGHALNGPIQDARVRWHAMRGWLFRDNRIVNWCSDCRTSISDLEVDHIDVDDALTYARYPLADGSGHLTIATVRPATILADVAVAVHPDDERYRDLIGKDVIVPVTGRHVPVIADERVEREFGTGALKVTPGHDPIDFEIGRDHDLPAPAVIGLDGRMTGDIPDLLIGLTEEEASEYVVDWLRQQGLLEKRESYRHSVGHCERSGTRIQPLASLQGWVDMGSLAAAAVDAIESGRVTFHPPVQNRVALDWLKNI